MSRETKLTGRSGASAVSADKQRRTSVAMSLPSVAAFSEGGATESSNAAAGQRLRRRLEAGGLLSATSTATAHQLRSGFQEETDFERSLMHRQFASGVSRHVPVPDLSVAPAISSSGVALSHAAAVRGLTLPGRDLEDETVPTVDFVVNNARVALKMHRHGAAGGSLAAADLMRHDADDELEASRRAMRCGIGTTEAVLATPGPVPASRRNVRGASEVERKWKESQGANQTGLHAYGIEVSRRTILDAQAEGRRPPTPTRPNTATSRWWEMQFGAREQQPPLGEASGTDWLPAPPPRPLSRLEASRQAIQSTAQQLVHSLRRKPSAVEVAFEANTLDDVEVAEASRSLVAARELEAAERARALAEGREPELRKHSSAKRLPRRSRMSRSRSRAIQSAKALVKHRRKSQALPVAQASRVVALAGMPGELGGPKPTLPRRFEPLGGNI